LNVAVHLARLGTAVRFIGAIGADVLGDRIERRLLREGVDTSWLVRDTDAPTGAYLKDGAAGARSVVYFRTGSAASRFGEVPAGALDGVRHLHVSGITAALSPACDALIERLLAGERTFTVSFDVNYRKQLWSPGVAAGRLRRLAKLADVVLVGRDESARLWGTSAPESVRALLPEVPELVVKDDSAAAHVWTGGGVVSVAPDPVAVVEPVGAGDAFAAGFIYARGQGRPPTVALRFGHTLARAALSATDDLGAPVPTDILHAVLAEEPVR
jgi:2-dehydro-3-deoxygluconokinase